MLDDLDSVMNAKIKSLLMVVFPFVIACALMLVSCSTRGPSAKCGRQDVIYVCGCGSDCKCATVSAKPGKCGCGHDLIPGHVKKVEANEAYLCMCDPGCKCSLDPKDSTKCGCGRPIRKVSLKETGIYFCSCGGSCCNKVSNELGKCKCGMQLKKDD